MLIDGLLHTVASIHPDYKPLIDFALAHEDQLEKVGPVIKAAAEEGPGAFAAAEKAAPELAKAIRNLAASIDDMPMNSSTPPGVVEDLHAENVTRQIVGFQKMTSVEERAWMDQKTTGVGS